MFSPLTGCDRLVPRAKSSRLPVPLPKDPYEAIRQVYLVGTDTKSEPFEGEARTPELPHIVAPPTCHVEESEGSGTSGARCTSSDSTVPLSPDHPLTHTTPVLVLTICRSGNGYSEKRTKNEAKTDKTEHGMERCEKSSQQSQSKKGQSQRRSQNRRNLKWANPYPFNGPGQPIKRL
nr:hypothetical protein [Tanacetum cinerariifolium]